MAFYNFEDLEVWKRGRQQAVAVCELVETWRNFVLKDQMIRSAISVPSNIAEGQERDSPGEFVRFLRIAKGSNGELRTQFYIAGDIGLIEEDVKTFHIAESEEISRMIQGLVRAIKPET
ncbi:four helix bundle protein [soil metagenome]